MNRAIKFEDFNLPESVNRIVIDRVVNGINKFLWKGKEIDKSMLPIATTPDEINGGALTFNIEATAVNSRKIIEDYRKEGWSLEHIKEGYAYFTNSLYTMDVYLGDIAENIIFFRYGLKGSITMSPPSRLKVFSSINDLNYYELPPVNDEVLEVYSAVSFRFTDLFHKGEFVKIHKTSLKYFDHNLSDDFKGDEVTTLIVNLMTDEVKRLIENHTKLGYVFIGICEDKIQFIREGIRYSVDLPLGVDGYIDFSLSMDGVHYTDVHRLRVKHIPDDDILCEFNEQKSYSPLGDMMREVQLSTANTIIIPSGDLIREVIIND